MQTRGVGAGIFVISQKRQAMPVDFYVLCYLWLLALLQAPSQTWSLETILTDKDDKKFDRNDCPAALFICYYYY